MKRFHLHVGVKNLSESIAFYSTLFGQAPDKEKEDYAKWMLDDPRINFAISTRVSSEGVDHLGIQVDGQEELAEITGRLKNADLGVYGEGEATCCYASSQKAWVKDPSGIAWETYQTMNDIDVFSKREVTSQKTDCCAPKKSCC